MVELVVGLLLEDQIPQFLLLILVLRKKLSRRIYWVECWNRRNGDLREVLLCLILQTVCLIPPWRSFDAMHIARRALALADEQSSYRGSRLLKNEV